MLIQNLVIHQMDLKTAFLSEDLEKEIYIEQLRVVSQLKKNREHSVAQIEYAQIIGNLMYLMNYTKPDIAYAVGRLSCGFPSVLEGFSDANWISNSDEMKSTKEYVFILGGSAVSGNIHFMDETNPIRVYAL
ncbi:hypothetical protein CK203_115792 [Vitis vinifera]|uniref:Reverse transcriptase Ty1/copia-type domain-containing protein n=1 Tax=Vitis vinifera TaxID=29760 RepID=A0A438E133_VITVI|nr:hypothetical protein CK203_115792 [Vitis vinifera]